MKVEFLSDISDGGKFKLAYTDQLVRLFDFDSIQADNFRKIIQQTLINQEKQLILNEIRFIESINCNLIFRISEVDIGITSYQQSIFFCDLTRIGYIKMINLIESFCAGDKVGYQWLYDIDTPIEFLFSPNGQW